MKRKMAAATSDLGRHGGTYGEILHLMAEMLLYHMGEHILGIYVM